MKQTGGHWDSGCSLEEIEPDVVIHARDLDGTGSAHICLDGDPGAFAYIRIDALPDAVQTEVRDVYKLK